jgi:hypothetical protein
VDREPVEIAATRLGVDPTWAAEHDERIPDMLEDLGRALAAATPELGLTEPPALDDRELADAVRSVIRSLADAGGYVILGRGAPAALSGREDVCSIRLVADERDRVARVERWQELEYVRRFYDADISDPTLYDAVLNTSRIGLDGAARVAEALVRWKLGLAA